MEVKLTVLFESPFWIGLFEISTNHNYSIYKYVFGNEPKDNEVYEMILGEYNKLNFYDSSYGILLNTRRKINPKRMQRNIQKELSKKGIGTKAQQAISAQREANKLQSRKMKKQKKEELNQLKYERRQEKKKQKKKGH